MAADKKFLNLTEDVFVDSLFPGSHTRLSYLNPKTIRILYESKLYYRWINHLCHSYLFQFILAWYYPWPNSFFTIGSYHYSRLKYQMNSAASREEGVWLSKMPSGEQTQVLCSCILFLLL